jgi:hypothetical protein
VRSVVVHLRDTNENDVTELLRLTYPPHVGPRWIADIGGDACLYITFYRDGPLEAGDWKRLVEAFGGEPSISIIADVSGRHPGSEQVRHFVTSLLGRFSGAAQDDYSPHLWSIDEIVSGHRVHGHPFFDYTGWSMANPSEV